MIRHLLAFTVVIVLVSLRSSSAEELLIIANPSVNISDQLTPRQVAAIYLLRMTAWPDGTRIIPVNRESTSDIRARFTGTVLKETNAILAEYWNEMHFEGKMPPIIQESEAAMLAFVQKVPGAVGYITTSSSPTGVKVVCRVP